MNAIRMHRLICSRNHQPRHIGKREGEREKMHIISQMMHNLSLNNKF